LFVSLLSVFVFLVVIVVDLLKIVVALFDIPTFTEILLNNTMDRLQQLMRGMPGGMGGAMASDSPTPDCAEKIHVSSLALLKMLKHGRCVDRIPWNNVLTM
jgi:hypothetical protein